MCGITLNNGMKALVDKEDFSALSRHHWTALKSRRTYYAVRGDVRMHRQIMNALPGILVDHINGNGLDNRRVNLRLCNATLNQANARSLRPHKTSRFKGVSWSTAHTGWFAQLQIERRKVNLGYYEDEEDAALAYNRAAIEHFGSFACLNDISISEFHIGKKIKDYFGTANPASKLNAQIVTEIRISQLPSKALASIHGVHLSTINRIRSGKTWPMSELAKEEVPA